MWNADPEYKKIKAKVGHSAHQACTLFSNISEDVFVISLSPLLFSSPYIQRVVIRDQRIEHADTEEAEKIIFLLPRLGIT